MSNILDYFNWRGDLTFEQDPFNDVDAAIMAQLSYLNFDSIVPANPELGMPLKIVWDKFRSAPDYENRCDLGMVINRKTVDVLEAAAKSKRFGSLVMCGYSNKIDFSNEEQFSAVTFLLNTKGKFSKSSDPFIVYRGTDDTIVGWKEDFNLALNTGVPSQQDAVDYANHIAKKCKGKLRIAGHSKGGNLAVYAGSFINKSFRKRLVEIYNFDGPGFTSQVMDTPEYKAAMPKINSWFPHFSVVGMFFEHLDRYTVVESVQHGIMQHDLMSWQILGKDFVTADELDAKSLSLNTSINAWLKPISEDKRAKIIDSVFSVLEATGASTNSEIEANLLKNSAKMIKAISKIDDEVRDEVSALVKLIVESLLDNSIFRK